MKKKENYIVTFGRNFSMPYTSENKEKGIPIKYCSSFNTLDTLIKTHGNPIEVYYSGYMRQPTEPHGFWMTINNPKCMKKMLVKKGIKKKNLIRLAEKLPPTY